MESCRRDGTDGMGLTIDSRKRATVQGAAVLSLTAFLALGAFIADADLARSAGPRPIEQDNLWTALISQASKLGLPTRFLRVIPPDFIAVEFADLRTFAAEYHPEVHRVILNSAFSFNAAGRILKPLGHISHRDIATIYHELFHAYLDYIGTTSDSQGLDTDEQRLLAFARQQQECRYSSVSITPLPQKKTMTEPRLLTEQESWEALNETWAVFVGWAIWSRLEIGGSGQSAREKFAKLLKKADRSGLLVGYYEPQDIKERAVTHKRYLASVNRITQPEVAMLLDVIFGENATEAARVASVMAPDPPPVPGSSGCRTKS